MTVEQFVKSRIMTIRANFAMRNSRVVSPHRMTRIKAQRRENIRRYIAELRVAKNPENHQQLSEHLRFLVV